MADQTLAPLAGNTLAIGSAALPVAAITTSGALTDPAGNASTPAQIKAARDAIAALGTISTQDSDDVAITGGSIAGITDLAVADGGTGASTAAGAVVNLLPAMAGNEGKVLAVATGEETTEWVAVGGSGTVTSVAVSGGTTGLTTSGGPVTASGTITLAGTLAVANGGTGATTAGAALSALGGEAAGTAAAKTLELAKAKDTYGFANRAETTIGFNDSTYTFTLTDAGAGWTYYRAGVRCAITGNKTLTLAGTPPTAGTNYIYIDDESGTLSVSATPWILDSSTWVPVAIVCWNNTLTPKYCLADERHNTSFSRTEHAYEHLTYGTRFGSGAVISGYTVGGSTDAENTYALTETVIWDEDYKHTLAALADDGPYHIEYRTGASTWAWLEQAIPFRYTAAGYIQYDNAGTMTEGQALKFYNTYVVATNASANARFAVIHGKAEYANLAAALAASFSDLTLTGLQFAEAVAVYQLTWQTSNAYSTSGKCRLAAAPKAIRATLVQAPSIPGAGTMATQNADAVAITGGTITGITDLAVADGGTGASDASGARTNLGLAIGTDVPALAHSHAGTTNGNKLAQANTHESADTDSATSSLHHTIGTGANQAAAGNHLHTGVYVPMIEPVEVLDITTGSTTPSITYRKGYLAIDAAVEIQLPVTTSMANNTCWTYDLRILHDGTNTPTMASGWREDANDVDDGIPFSTDANAEDILVLSVEKDASGNLKTAAGLAFGDLT